MGRKGGLHFPSKLPMWSIWIMYPTVLWFFCIQLPTEYESPCLLDRKGALLSKHKVSRLVIKVLLCFLKADLLQVQFINNSVMECFQRNSRSALLPRRLWNSSCWLISYCWQYPASLPVVIPAEERSLVVLCHIYRPFWLLSHVLCEAVPGTDLSEAQ